MAKKNRANSRRPPPPGPTARPRPASRQGARGAARRPAPPSREDWIVGDQRMTPSQASHLSILAAEAGEPFEDSLTKSQAAELIEQLQRRTGRARGW